MAIAPQGNYKEAEEKLVAAVTQIYAQSKDEIERQHRTIEQNVDIYI
jgi:hypothetical protein